MAEVGAQLSYETWDGDPAAADEALRSLAGELDLAPDVRVTPADPGPAPEGARADAATVQAILVSVPAVLTSIQSLATLLQSWKRRREDAGESGRLKVQIGSDVIELDQANEDARRRVVESWLAAHATAGGE